MEYRELKAKKERRKAMGMSASQARFLSVTSRISDLGLRGQSIAEQRIRLSMDMEGIGKAYNQDISDRRLYTDTTNFVGGDTYGNRDFISYANLLEQGLYVFDGEKVLGYGEKTGVVGKETYISGYENDMNRPNGWDKMLAVVGQTDDKTKPIAWGNKTVTDYDNVTKWSQKEVAGDPIHHPAGFTVVSQVTEFGEPKTGAKVLKGESLAGMNSVVASTGKGSNDLKVVSYQTPVNNKMVTVNSVAIKSQAGFDAIMAKLAAGDANALEQNYVLDLPAGTKADMSAYKNWSGISNFSGMFDGNMNTIENLTGSQGLFASLSGQVQNLTLDKVNITSSNDNIGGIAGSSSGKIIGCNVNNLNITQTGSYPRNIGGVVGNSTGTVDRTSVKGNITLPNNTHYDAIGGFAGNNSGSTNITKSYADVNITVKTPGNGSDCLNTFIGCDITPITMSDCYSLGTIKTTSGGSLPVTTLQNAGLGHDASKTSNCYSLDTKNNSSAAFWNGDKSSSNWGSSSSTIDKSKFQNEVITTGTGANIPVWLFPGDAGYADQVQGTAAAKGLPVLNIAAMNIANTDAWDEATTKLVNDQPIEWGTKVVDDLESPIKWTQKDVMGYVDDKTKPNSWEQNPVYSERDVYGPVMDMDKEVIGMTSENLEYGLRSGKLQLYKMADEFSNTVKEFGVGKFQPISWQTCTVISDDLYKDNDAQAQAKYDVEMKKLQTKDKRLELEQKNVDTEYKALTTEHDSIKKVIDKNIETSFKMFG